MKVIAISDTHGRHSRLVIPDCDLLIHAGDLTMHGGWHEIERAVDWMGRQPARHRVVIAGNHDHGCESDPERMRALAEKHRVHYLQDELIEIENRRIWGSPVTPKFHSLAFNRERGAQIREHWDRIPHDLDVLITHGPPRGVRDRTMLGARAGCDDLLTRVKEVQPRFHVFGHIHEDAGDHCDPRLTPTRFINACNSRLVAMIGVRPPVSFTI